ncbi:rhomboid family intramembrane serine protease [uncultured Enterovirga sp.]|uniref:rhomboid family intramembrane serine protease n=1 Tax=uncultured Enterovirga sp. TaxID=2026352 RepID=UPI0035C96A96
MRPIDGAAPRERAINMPTGLLVAIGLLFAIQGIRSWLDDVTDLNLLVDLSFIPASWSAAFGWATPEEVVGAVGRDAADPQSAFRVAWAQFVTAEGRAYPWTWLSYAVLHGSWTHVALNGVWLAAFGTPVVRRVGGLRSLVLAAATAIGGATAQWIADPLSAQPMIGASASVSGFMAAAATFIFARRPESGMAAFQHLLPRRAGPDWSFLRHRSVLTFLAVWFAGNLLFGLIAVPLGIAEGAGIAWQAHIGGLVVGLLLFPFIDPGPAAEPPRGFGA